MTHLHRAQEEYRNQSPAAEPVPVQAATINVDGANRMECDLVVAAINH